MNLAALLAYERLNERRQSGRIPWWMLTGVAVGVGAGLGIRAGYGLDETRAWWHVALALATALVVMGGPFRLFWRPDARILARLPIAGATLYGLATYRAARLAVGLAPALAAWAACVDPSWQGFALLLLVLLAATSLAPPASAFAGWIIVSEKAQGLLREAAGGQTAPSVVWLSLLPAMGGMTAGKIAFSGSLVEAAILAGASLLVFVVGLRVAASSLSDATREVAAMDAVKLAHVDIVSQRGLEKLWGALAGAGRVVYAKNVALMRRRHAGYYVACDAILVAMWIATAAASEPLRSRLVIGGALALVAYAALLGRRLAIEPTEQPRLIATLPLPPGAPERARRAYVAWRILWLLALGVMPLIARHLA